jgi:hypothetical protein
MAIMRCKVSFTDSEGTEHAVEVEAESLYDAVGLAIARFHDAPKRDALRIAVFAVYG